MPAQNKRGRQVDDEVPGAPSTPPPSEPRQTRRTTATSASTTTATTTLTSTRSTNTTLYLATTPTIATPTRPALTRSATMIEATPASAAPLTRTTSLQPRLARRQATSALQPVHTRGGLSENNAVAGPSRLGSIARSTSSSSIASSAYWSYEEEETIPVIPESEKKPDGDSGRWRYDPGKENIPPAPDNESSRKKPRVSRSVSYASSRARSSSIASVRSDASSFMGLGGASVPLSRMPSQIPSESPTPSLDSSASRSFDSCASPDPIDFLEIDDVDKTPTKPKALRHYKGLPTPPPSSPRVLDDQIEIASKRMELVRMQSGSSVATDSTEVSEEADDFLSLAQNLRNPYKQLKLRLRLSSAQATGAGGSVVVGREEEKAVLQSYLTLQSANDAGLYVSGPPGTGKTALVTATGRQMAAAGWTVIEIGCMGMKIGDIWARLGQALGCGTSESAVRGYLYGLTSNVMIILDEIDSLMPPAPSAATPATSAVLSKIFGLPMGGRAGTMIKVVAISNTLDLTIRARLVLPKGAQPQVLPFKAYVATDMVAILNARIASAAVGQAEDKIVKVDSKAVELLTRKVEAQNGDLRMCLGCLSAAVNLAEAEWHKKSLVLAEGITIPLTKVAIPHAIKAFNSHTQQLKAAAGTTNAASVADLSHAAKKIRSVALQGKIVLISIMVYLSRVRAGLAGCPAVVSATSSPQNTPTKAGDLTTSTLYATYAYLLSHSTAPFPPAAESDYRDLLSNLETLGLVAIGSASTSGRGRSATNGAHGPSVKLCAREDEVRAGLGLALGPGTERGMADEEVHKIWDREQDKVRRANEKLLRAMQAAAADSAEQMSM